MAQKRKKNRRLRPPVQIQLHNRSHHLPLPVAYLGSTQNMPHLSPLPKFVSLSIDSQVAIIATSLPSYSYQVPLLRDIRNTTSTLTGSAVQVAWAPSHTGITGNGLVDAAEDSVLDSFKFPQSSSHLRSQIHG